MLRQPKASSIRWGDKNPVHDVIARLMTDDARARISRRRLLQALGLAAAGAPLTAYAQGRFMRTFGTPGCNTTALPPLFVPSRWEAVALDHIAFEVAEYQKEATFYAAPMGWTLRSDDGK